MFVGIDITRETVSLVIYSIKERWYYYEQPYENDEKSCKFIFRS